MATEQASFTRRVYPLDPKEVSEEELAVVFAMTSRRPEPFDEIKDMVTAEKASDFHERWVLGYGHASVAEHAIVHLAVENVSRLACDTLEDNRLASYTEKSSRYQVLERNAFYTPPELDADPGLRDAYTAACERLFDIYHDLVERTQHYLASVNPQRENERDGAYRLRLRRIATDHCRFTLPAATLTNVGVTLNARSMEHAISKLLSSELAEARDLGAVLKDQGRAIAPTLIKYADASDYLTGARRSLTARSAGDEHGPLIQDRPVEAKLVEYTPDAQDKLVTSLLFSNSGLSYAEAQRRGALLGSEERRVLFNDALDGLGPFDAPLRDLEMIDYLFELTMDYGAYREYKRHRMQTYLPQPLTPDLGYVVPFVVADAGAVDEFEAAMAASAEAYAAVAEVDPHAAQYVVTHAHNRRLLVKINLRECFHLLKLRSAKEAHFTIQDIARGMLAEIERVHPELIGYIRLREG